MSGAGVTQDTSPLAEFLVDWIEAVQGATDPSDANDPGLTIATDFDLHGFGSDL